MFKVSKLTIDPDAKVTMHVFSSLALAARYIEQEWEGSDMMDGIKSFTSADGNKIYNLHGFTLSDVGEFVVNKSSQIRDLVFFSELTNEDLEACRDAEWASCSRSSTGAPNNDVEHTDSWAFKAGFKAAIRYMRVPKIPGNRDSRV